MILKNDTLKLLVIRGDEDCETAIRILRFLDMPLEVTYFSSRRLAATTNLKVPVLTLPRGEVYIGLAAIQLLVDSVFLSIRYDDRLKHTPMSNEKVLSIFKKAGALITDSHIVYTSGKHGSAYVNKDALYPDTDTTSLLCHEIAVRFRYEGIEVVIGPAIGGVILAQWTAHYLTTMSVAERKVLAAYAEKTEDQNSFVIKRGYDELIEGKRVLVVEDVLTTGGSAKKVIRAVRGCGGNVIGLVALCNRGKVTGDYVDANISALVQIELEAWDEADCPLCEKQVPINTEVGKGREFLSRQSK